MMSSDHEEEVCQVARRRLEPHEFPVTDHAAGIKPDTEQRHHDRPDVPAVTRDEDPHYYPQESGYEFDGVIKPLI